MKRIITASALALALGAGAAAAQSASDLERFEAASEAMSEKMFGLLEAQIPGVAGNLPDPTWDAEFRSAAECMLTNVREESSQDNVDRLLGEIEGMAAMDFESLEDMQQTNFDMDPGLPRERMSAINQECGLQELTRSRAEEVQQAVQQAMQGG
ncbi:MAG: hypothetical protein GVY27_06800 [Deinococcus-Thermus bacterium]|jgi:hypothetical protein|nr:hypothetical protein [Deinococcota bacterium]